VTTRVPSTTAPSESTSTWSASVLGPDRTRSSAAETRSWQPVELSAVWTELVPLPAGASIIARIVRTIPARKTRPQPRTLHGFLSEEVHFAMSPAFRHARSTADGSRPGTAAESGGRGPANRWRN
jgi:hypothetical protein